MEIVPYTTSGYVKEMCKFHEHWKCTETWNFCTFTVDFRTPEIQLFFLCLGPLFFVLFINDLLNCLQFSIPFVYADDTKCLKQRCSLETIEADFLQKDIDNLFHWSVSSDLYFSFSKFTILGKTQH